MVLFLESPSFVYNVFRFSVISFVTINLLNNVHNKRKMPFSNVFGKQKSLLSKSRYSCGRMLILTLRGHHCLLDAASVLHQRRPQEGPDDVGAFLRDGVPLVLVRLEETWREN